MSKVENAVLWALDIAADAAHGYDQSARWGPDYDCSALVISAFEQAGVPLRSAGATYTGNMRRAFKKCGFAEVADGSLRRGDVLLAERCHTALYVGDGRLVHAAINERGGVTGGAPGDQTGREICVRDYYDRPWDCVLRYAEDGAEPDAPPAWTGVPELQSGDTGHAVSAMQHILLAAGYALPRYGADGDFGGETADALTAFQTALGLAADGVCGSATWGAMIGGVK